MPHAEQALVRLGSEVSFEAARRHLEAILGIQVSAASLRRQTLRVGPGVLAVQTQQAQPQAVCPEEPAVERLAMSADGAYVSLLHKQWGEVKLLAIGQIGTRQRKQEQVVCTTQLSYFVRLADAATFAEQASAEIRRRGIERADAVCAVQDGAEWLQGFVQSHRADALRILEPV